MIFVYIATAVVWTVMALLAIGVAIFAIGVCLEENEEN